MISNYPQIIENWLILWCRKTTVLTVAIIYMNFERKMNFLTRFLDIICNYGYIDCATKIESNCCDKTTIKFNK
jgi:hypothetical protein